MPVSRYLTEGLRPSDSPTRSLARRFAGALRSRGSLAALVRCRPRPVRACAIVILGWAVLAADGCARRSTVPAALSDREFWSLIEALSEPPGRFTVSDDLLSNEPHVAENVRQLPRSGGVYIGVGPEQNFSYIERARPQVAFIVDIRRENLSLHLLYKALFDLSADRADFVSRLFSRGRPSGLDAGASAQEVFKRFGVMPPSSELLDKTGTLVRERLLTARGLPLPQADLDWIARVLKAFYEGGPEIRFWGTPDIDAIQPSYRELMTARDIIGLTRSYLASEEGFHFVKEVQSRNLVVPVVGDFGGQGALRRIGDYVRARGDAVQAFYGSNVGVYLNTQQQKGFCANLESLPRATGAWFIERDGLRLLSSRLKACSGPAK